MKRWNSVALVFSCATMAVTGLGVTFRIRSRIVGPSSGIFVWTIAKPFSA